MILSKFEKKKQELIERQKQELQELQEQERRERERLVKPVIEKMTKVATEETRKLLEKQPELLEGYTFRKREAAKVVREALEKIFAEGQDEAGSETAGKPKPQTALEVEKTVPSAPDDVFDES